MNPNLSDKAKIDYNLVKLAIEGDQKAYEELYIRYKDSIFFMLLKMVKNKDDAEDLTFEAFGKAFRNLSQYRPKFAFSTWLFKIASNNCIDFIRKRQSDIILCENSESLSSEKTLKIESTDLNPEQVCVKRQKALIMQCEVNKLKERYRILIQLRYFNEFSYEEIASHLRLPIGTIKAQLSRARELLFNNLKDKELIKDEVDS
jgi:RNA polymerase sigma-70 factor (ECF subfamily)